MADEQTPKKVVKRVVKRPIAPGGPSQKPQMRYGRPATGPTKVAARDEPAPAPPTSPAGPQVKAKPPVKRPVKQPAVKAPNVDVKPALAALRTRTSSAATAIGSRAGRAGRATGSFTAARWSALRAWRIPPLEPVRASLVTGLVAGLVSVVLGVAALRVFTEVRGVASGGGTWGSLTFVVVTVIAFVIGERLLTAFGTPLARLTSFLGIVLTIIAILSVFLGVADSRYGLVVVPALAAVAFLAAHWVLAMAESSSADVE